MNHLAPYDGPWTATTARHLLRRAGFGLPVERVEQLTALGRAAAVDLLIEESWRDDEFGEPDFLPDAVDLQEARRAMQGASEEERQRAQREFQREQRQAMQELVLWWMKRMFATSAPLREKMTLFWHGHFAVSAEKVRQARLNYDLNHTLRRHALGRLEPMLLAVARSPAMLRYLDNDRNLKGQPNENFARELMELFTLGIGHYGERDVKEAARAFTGWSSNGTEFAFRARQHDTGRKAFLGREGQFGGEDILRIILEQPQTARFLVAKLWRHLAYEEPEADLVEALGDAFRRSRYDITELLRTILNSAAFYSPRAVWTQIKGPVFFLVGLHGLLDASTPRRALILPMLRLLGQVPFHPPNVKGWDGGRAWINANTLLLRANIANFLVNGELPDLREGARRPPAAARGAGVVRGGDDMASMDGERGMADDRAAADANPSMDELAERDLMEQERLAAERTPIEGVRMRPPLDLPAFLERLGGATPTELVDRATAHLIGHPLSRAQRATLLDALSGVGPLRDPRRLSREDQEKVRGMLHLLLASAEFQLC